ncbi:MAG: hypothetical protein R3C59_03830 [Planctomycetaceae bacterium]
MDAMKLYRLQIRPLSPWATPWQADTLFGLLCWTCARTSGAAVLQQEILEPSLDRRPPFVVSDAFPSGWFPVPASLKSTEFLNSRPKTDRGDSKLIRKSNWMTRAGFLRYVNGEPPTSDSFARISPVTAEGEVHNQIARGSGSTDNGELFVSDTWQLRDGVNSLDVFVRTTPAFLSRFSELMVALSQIGFGADISTGRGEFEVIEAAVEETELPATGSRCVVLSTFQPHPEDPIDGCWDLFTKYGKLGAGFGVDNVFKRPMLMLRPGAVFQPYQDLVGHCLRGCDFLSTETLDQLHDSRPAHGAFGLTVGCC